MRCKGMKADGTACRASAHLVGDGGYCDSHNPSKRDEMRERAAKGGEATARRFKATGLDESELPPLTSPEVAEIWLERIARKVAIGELPHQDARAATSALQQWLKAHEVGKLVDRIETLREQLNQVRAAR